MSGSLVLNPRKPLLWLGLAAGAAIFFASGALAARAVIDTGDKDDTTSVASADTPGAQQPGVANTGSTAPRFGPGAQQTSVSASAPSPEKMAGQGGAADASFYYPGCRAPLPASVLNNGVIDPSKAGFTPNLPNSGFSALQISLSVYAECDENGAPKPGGELALDSSWKHDETGIEAYISQRKSEKRVASVLRDDMASFWAGGLSIRSTSTATTSCPTPPKTPPARRSRPCRMATRARLRSCEPSSASSPIPTTT